MRKRILGILLTMMLVVGMMPGMVFAEDNVAATAAETFVESEESTQSEGLEAVATTHSHDGVTFTEWTATSGDIANGTYYLSDDVQASGDINITGNVTLCLNGNTLNMGWNSIDVKSNGTFNVSDCRYGIGAIKGKDTVITNQGNATINSGRIDSGRYAIFNNGGNAHIKGGDVITSYGTAIDNLQGGQIYLSGNPYIKGKYGDISIKGGADKLYAYEIENTNNVYRGSLIEISSNSWDAGDSVVYGINEVNVNKFDTAEHETEYTVARGTDTKADRLVLVAFTHEHNYSWQHDENEHWQECGNKKCPEKEIERGAHSYGDDYTCDKCDYLNIVCTYDNCTVGEQHIHVGDSVLTDNQYVVVGDTTPVSGKPDEAAKFAWYNGNTLTLNNYTFEYTERFSKSAIHSSYDLEINLHGTNNIISTGHDGVHVYSKEDSDPNLIIAGDGSLNANGSASGIYCGGKITINRGTITTQAGTNGIRGDRGIVINGGELIAIGGFWATQSNVTVGSDLVMFGGASIDGTNLEVITNISMSYKYIKVEPCNHVWDDEPTWKWTGTSEAKATFTCSVGKHTKTVAAETITSNVTTAPNCVTPGTAEYTATVAFDGGTYTSTKQVSVPAINHSWDSSWKSNTTHHWHSCGNTNCPITENSAKAGYSEHISTGSNVADCLNLSICDECGMKYGTVNPENHALKTFAYTDNPDSMTHSKVYGCCGVVINAKEVHSYGDNSECELCGYNRGKDYNITEGANQTVKLGEEATFRSDAEYDTFMGVLVDGTIVDPSNYDSKAGSIIVTLKEDFVKGLSAGEHTLTIVSNDGEASTKFTVAAAETKPEAGTTTTPGATDKTETKTDEAAQTSDAMNISLYGAMMLIAAAGMLGAVVYRRKEQ